jgi:hypothetical protein
MVMPALHIYTIAEEVIKPAFRCGGCLVSALWLHTREWELIYDQQKLAEIGISSSAINASIKITSSKRNWEEHRRLWKEDLKKVLILLLKVIIKGLSDGTIFL